MGREITRGGGSSSLSHPPLINREGLLVLMKASRRLGYRTDSQTKQDSRARLSIALKVAVQASSALGFSYAIVPERKMIHPDLEITCGSQHLARQLVKRAFLARFRQVVIAVTALCRLDPGYEREAVKRDPIRPQSDRLLNCLSKTLSGLAWQPVDQIVVDG